ncbi:MAG: hypothetical protein QXY49_04890 [Thermofilaceae archaeon]
MATRAVRVLKLTCPDCGKGVEFVLDATTLTAALSSPTGLVGVADYHGDHVFVVYVDAEGHDRGIRVFRTLQKGETLRVNPAYLNYMSHINGFRLSTGGGMIECYRRSMGTALKISEENSELELELSNLDLAKTAVEWARGYLKGLAKVPTADLGTILLSTLLLDASISTQPSPFMVRLFELAFKSRKLVVKVDTGAVALFKEYVNRLPWISPRIIDWAAGLDGWRLVDAVLAQDPVTMRERFSGILALERRGIIRFEEVAG